MTRTLSDWFLQLFDDLLCEVRKKDLKEDRLPRVSCLLSIMSSALIVGELQITMQVLKCHA